MRVSSPIERLFVRPVVIDEHRLHVDHLLAARPRPIHEVPPYDIMVTPVQAIFPAFRVAHGPQSIHDEGDPVRIQSRPLWKHLQKCVRCSMSPCHDVGMRGRRVLQIEWAFLLTVVRIGARGCRSRSTDLPYRSRSRPGSPASGTRSPAYRTDPLYSTLRCLSGTHQRDLAARAVPFPRLLALRDVLPDPVQTCSNTSAGIVKLGLTAVFDAQHGGPATGSSPVSWGAIDVIFVNLTMPETLRVGG